MKHFIQICTGRFFLLAFAAEPMAPADYVDPRIGNVAPFITHDQIMTGGTLVLELGERPNRSWGVE